MSNVDERENASGGKGVADELRRTAGDFTEQAKNVAEDATDAATSQASGLADMAKDLASDAGEKLRASVNEQKAVGADYVQGVAGMIRRSASEFDNELPQASHYIREAASQLEGVSEAIRNRDVSEIVGSAQNFARNQPTAFFGAAVLLGFAAIRLVKSGSGKPAQSGSSHSGGADD